MNPAPQQNDREVGLRFPFPSDTNLHHQREQQLQALRQIEGKNCASPNMAPGLYRDRKRKAKKKKSTLPILIQGVNSKQARPCDAIHLQTDGASDTNVPRSVIRAAKDVRDIYSGMESKPRVSRSVFLVISQCPKVVCLSSRPVFPGCDVAVACHMPHILRPSFILHRPGRARRRPGETVDDLVAKLVNQDAGDDDPRAAARNQCQWANLKRGGCTYLGMIQNTNR